MIEPNRFALRGLLLALLTATCLATAPRAWPADAASLWRSLGWFEGHWVGQESGVPGDGPGRRCYSRLLDDRFLYMRAETRFRPQPRTPGNDHQQQWQIFSRDHDDQRILLRRFGSGGQVMSFVLDPEASRSDRFVFESLAFDQAPDAAHGRLTLLIGRDNSFREQLDLGADRASLKRVLEGRWRRSDRPLTPCAPAALDF